MHRVTTETIPLIYRPYNLPVNFPVIAFLGDLWLVSMKEPKFFHFHNCMEIGCCISGSGSIYTDNKKLSYKKGDYSIVFENEPHISVCDDEPSKWIYIYFEPQLLLNTVHERFDRFFSIASLSHSSLGVIKEHDNALLCSLLRQIFAEFGNRKALYQDSVSGLLLSVLALLEQQPVLDSTAENDRHQLGIIQNAFLYIQKNYAKAIDISELATVCRLSESHFRRLFKTITGYSPLECIQHYRIRQACHHIYRNQDSIGTIAHLVGYTTLSSFNRQFQQCMHMSPSEWKKECTAIISQNEVTSFEDENTRHIFGL